MPNDFTHLKDATLADRAHNTVTNLAGRFAEYGLTEDEFTQLALASDQMAEAITNLRSAETHYRRAAIDKANARKALEQRMSQIAAISYAQTTVNDAQLLAISLAPRPKPRRHVSPIPPRDLIVTPTTSGLVELKWDKNKNTRATIFVIERRTPEGWEILALTTRSKITLAGFALGVPQLFRVRAQLHDQTSLPTQPAALWPPVPAAA